VPRAGLGIAFGYDLIPEVVTIEPSVRHPGAHTGTAMDPITIILISLTTLVAANLAAVRSKG
jgi:hypothetical protein